MTNQLAITAITSAAPSAPLVLRGDLTECVGRARELGDEAREVHVVDAGTFPTEEVLAACEAQGRRISAVVTGRIFTERGLCMTSPDPENRAGAMAELRDYIDVAARLRATDGVVIGWVKGNRRPEDPDFDRLLAEQLSELGEYAGQRGQTLLVEVINRYETNLFNTSEELVRFIRKWDLRNCRVHLDTFHMNIEEADMAAAIHTAGDLLGYFHVADSNRLTPGMGHLDFPAVFAALRDSRYQGTVSLECIPGEDAAETGAQGYAFLKNMLEKC